MAGKIQIYTGAGKGKTTAALGLCLRFLGSGGKVCLIQFDKGSEAGKEFYSERNLLRRLEGLTLEITGCPRFDEAKQSFRFENGPQDFEEAKRGLSLAKNAFKGEYGLIILDEVLSLVLTKLAKKEDIAALVDDFIALGKPCELVLTGHAVWPELIERADLVTEMRKMKHYFDHGQKARKGIEY